ncbi:MAG TPA: sugar ABC transporter substrate-binding protein [Dongiaceae bacterium]|nr:sugar ABC transporter substrate-binding protein [Dongiaceae bacterium]
MTRTPGSWTPARTPRWIVVTLAVGSVLAAGGCAHAPDRGVTLRFWAMGREGEVVQELMRDFERGHPGIHVVVQQIPWNAAHEKLLTAVVGGSTPDVTQLGNTWVPEFVALRAIAPLDRWVATSRAVSESTSFAGIWDTNQVGGRLYGVPWYVDTRVLFYRKDMLTRAGFDSIPGSWDRWRAAMEGVRKVAGPGRYAIFLPTNEYTPWIVFGMQAGSPLLRDHDTRGAFSQPAYRRAADFYLDLFHRGLAPAVQGASIANRYQEFERGTFSMYISGPWDVGEFRRRLSPAMDGRWGTAPLPGPDGPASGVSTAGGSSLVLFRRSKHPDEAWQLIEYLSLPEVQLRFHHLTGDLPACRAAWSDTAFTNDPCSRAFAIQLERTVATPKVPEWENISLLLQDTVERMVLGHVPPDSALAGLDREVDRVLEKRRWLVERETRTQGGGR